MAEKIKNIEPISTFTTNLELVANLVEGEQGVNYKDCLNSLFFLTNHCYNSYEKEIRISSLPFLQISAMAFGALPINFRRDEKIISRLFETFRSLKTEPIIKESFYEFVKTTMKTQEQGFSNDLSKLIEVANIGMKKYILEVEAKLEKENWLNILEVRNMRKV